MQRTVWIQLYSRESLEANDESVIAKQLCRSDILDVPIEVVNVARLVHYIFKHDKFRNKLAGIQPHDVYVYSDADCKDPVPLDEMLSDIQTSASQPLRFVRPESGSSYPYG